jgi:hypothetical protein
MFRNSFTLVDQVKRLIYQYNFQNNCTILCFAPWVLIYSAYIMPKIPRILNIPRKDILSFFVTIFFAFFRKYGGSIPTKNQKK